MIKRRVQISDSCLVSARNVWYRASSNMPPWDDSVQVPFFTIGFRGAEYFIYEGVPSEHLGFPHSVPARG